MLFRFVIMGRPNVGKSTLFNRLVGKPLALVHDHPGVTRDRQDGEMIIGDQLVQITDTAGLGDCQVEPDIEYLMRQQTGIAVSQADGVIFVVDARAGLVADDREFIRIFRKFGKPLILVANKCEGRGWEGFLGEIAVLGLGEPVAISAAHGEGILDLYRRLGVLIEAKMAGGSSVSDQETREDEIDREPKKQEHSSPVIRVAVIGRPNAGKSTLINRLFGASRLLTGDQPGMTRDSIRLPYHREGHDFLLIDTAGMRRYARIGDMVEKIAARETRKMIGFCHIALLILDAEIGLERQDLRIARTVAETGRGMVVIVNKIDLVSSRTSLLQGICDYLDRDFPHTRGVSVIGLSALKGYGIEALPANIIKAYTIWNRRISTAKLNAWLTERLAETPPALSPDGRLVKLRYITQIKTRPPGFALFLNRPDALAESYRRFLLNRLRQDFDLWGVPLRLLLKKGKNPYIQTG